MTARTRAVAYLRVSTDKQADRGVSLDAQRSKVEAYAALYEIDLVAVEVDAGYSACTLDRPGLARALEALRRRRADALLVVKLDRLTRSVRDLADLLERDFAPGGAGRRGAALLSVAEQVDTRSAAGRMVLNILTTVGQWEREAIGERTAAAMAHLRAEGRHTGGDPPFGWAEVAGLLVETPEEQATLVRARALRAAGLSMRAVAETLEAEGHAARAGRVIGAGHVQRWLATAVRTAPRVTRQAPECGTADTVEAAA